MFHVEREGWHVVSLSKLEETVPGGEWCRGVTVGSGFEVAWKGVKWQRLYHRMG